MVVAADESRGGDRAELLARGPVPAGYREGGTALIVLTVASALTLAALWWSPLASLLAAVALLCAQSLAGYEFTQAAVWAVIVASFATVAFDHWKRAVAAGFVVSAGDRHRLRRAAGAHLAVGAEHLGLALHRVGGGGRSSVSTAAASSGPSAGPRSSRPTARRAPARR